MLLNHLKQHKKFSAAIAAVIILITILAGTFAWYTFSQNRINTFKMSATAPNVNLHDDFAGGLEKDVYVENSGGFNVLVRVRLSELIKYYAINTFIFFTIYPLNIKTNIYILLNIQKEEVL